VTILQRSDRLMGKQLDAVASELLATELRQRGIEIVFHAALVELAGADQIKAVRISTPNAEGFSDFRTLEANLFVFATGTVPNKELAGAAQLDCEKGILVNEYLQTSDPAILAIGECAQFQDYLAGTTAGVRAQARAAAEYLRGHEQAPFSPVPMGNILKIADFQLATAGITDVPAEALPEEYEVVTLQDSRRRYYQKCIIRNDRLLGVICMGDTRMFGQYLEWMQSGLELEGLRETLLRSGPAAAPMDGKLVCSCHQVGAGTIEKAIPVCGGDLQKVCTTTRAGSGCGSCRPEVAAILTRWRKIARPAAALAS